MKSATLIPIDNQAVTRAQEVLKKTVMFTDIDQFITMYNMNLLSGSNSAVATAAQALIDNFSNLTRLNGKFILKSETETAIEDTIQLLTNWKTLIKLKRIASLMIEEEYDFDTTKIVFSDDNPGKPYVSTLNVEGDETLEKYWASEKITNRTSDFANNILLRPFVHSYNEEGTACYFLIEDIIDIDDSFILDIQQEIIKNSIKGDTTNQSNDYTELMEEY
mgnify:FL=1|jgi:hypothetical protein